MAPGSSLGGARPKAVVEDDGALWIAKFNRQDDRYRDISRLFKDAVERKGPGREEGTAEKKRRKA